MASLVSSSWGLARAASVLEDPCSMFLGNPPPPTVVSLSWVPV